MNKYQIAFTSVAFNNTYDDVYRFDSRAEQQSFFEVTRLFQNAPYINILLGSFVNMTITYKLDGGDIFEFQKNNYAIIRETITDNDVTSYKYYYYFVNSLQYDSGNQFIADLECDVMQTYYIDTSFAPCVINKAHVDRWSRVGSGQVEFNNAPSSLMLIPDTPTPLSKYCMLRDRLVLSGNKAIYTWLNNNVEAWVYIYLYRKSIDDGSDIKYKVKKFDGTTDAQEPFDYVAYDDGSGHIRSQERYFSVVCYPIYRKTAQGVLAIKSTEGGNTLYTTINVLGEEAFNNLNYDTSFYISKQISRIPPFWLYGTEGTDYVISGNNLQILSDVTGLTNFVLPTNLKNNGRGLNFIITASAGTSERVGLLNPTALNTSIGLEPETFTNIVTKFNISDVVGADYNPAFNPKLLGSQFMELCVSNECGDKYSYDFQKLNNTPPKFIYSEYPAPCGGTRGYLRLASESFDYGCYTSATQQNLTGLVFTQDTNLNYTNDQLASYLANNRNWQTQISARIGQNMLNVLFGAGGELASALLGGRTGKTGKKETNANIASAEARGGLSMAQTVINEAFSLWNTFLSFDNMRGAPDMMASANGVIMFNDTYSEIGLYFEVYTSIDMEALREAQRMNIYGFGVGQIGSIKDCDNIRKYFNFVSANVSEAVFYDGSDYVGLPLPILNIFKTAFNKGVRFWNVYETSSYMNYSKENYERNLEVTP